MKMGIKNLFGKRLIIGGLVVALTLNAFGVLIPFVSPTASAIVTEATKQSCFDALNGKRVTNPTGDAKTLYDDCMAKSYCTILDANTKLVSCIDPVEEAQSQQDAFNAEVTPLIDLACLPVNKIQAPSEADAQAMRDACVNKIKEFYTTCQYDNTGKSRSSDEIAKCITPLINGYDGAENTSVTTIKTAIEDGQGQSSKILKDASKSRQQTSCESAGGTWKDGKCTDTAPNNNVTCAGGALGWLFCPLAQAISDATVSIANYIDGMLRFNPLILGNGGTTGNATGDAIYQVWRIAVGPANLLLIVAFLIVIFSQATSFGLSAYGIKKMLPRIVAAAILINLSFFICAIAVDISNVLGASIQGIITSIQLPNTINDPHQTWGVILSSILAALGVGTAAVVAVSGALFYILPMLLAALSSVVTAFLVLAARQVLITLLIVISPLAFAALVLPNTNELFTKWRKFFVVLLAMYPIIMLMFYGSVLVSNIIQVTPTTDDVGVQIFQKLIQLAVLIMPLFALPTIMKMAGGILERFGMWANDRSKGLTDRSRNWAKEHKDRTQWSQSWANRKNTLNDRAQRNWIRKAQSGKGYTGISGIGLGREAKSIRSTALEEARKKLDDREVAGHLGNLDKKAATMLAEGATYNSATKSWSHGGQTYTQDQLDPLTWGALKYANDNKILGTKNGAQAIAQSLINTGEVRMSHIENLAKKIGSDGERGIFIENARASAQSAGIDSLKYMTIDSKGAVDFAGVTHKPSDPPVTSAQAKASIAKRIVNSGPSKLNKYMFEEEDADFVNAMGAELLDKETSSSDWFETELAGMGADSVAKMAKMIYASTDGRATFANENAAKAHYAAAHNAARAKHHK